MVIIAVTIFFADDAINSKDSISDKNQRLLMSNMLMILMINLQLLRILRIFEFFQSFLRQLIEITKSISQISFILFFTIFVLAELFWILEKGNSEATLSDKPFGGFFYAILHSYKFSIGDFEAIANDFEDTTQYIWLYGIVFVIGSIMTLIILLNMVIAIMSMSLENAIVSHDALVNRERLTECVSNYHRLP